MHLAVPRVDAGPILAQRRIEIDDDDTAGTLSKRLVEEGLGALDETLAKLQAGRIDAIGPELERGTYEPPVRQTGLDWDQHAGTAHLRIEEAAGGQGDVTHDFALDAETRTAREQTVVRVLRVKIGRHTRRLAVRRGFND